MRFNITLKIFSGTLWCLFLFSAILNGQTYNFKNYGAESNIPDLFVYTINQSNDGFLWVGTSIGLSRFDGFNYYSVQYPDSSRTRIPTSSIKDKNGRLWFGCTDGSVFYVRDNKLISVPISNSKSISDIVEGPDGLIYIIPQGKAVFEVNSTNPEETHKYSFSIDPVMFSASYNSSGNLLIGTQENLLICELVNDSVSVVDVIEGFDYASVTSILQTDDSSRVILGTDGNGLFQLIISEEANTLTRFDSYPEWESLSVQSIYKDDDNYIWISTFGSGVIQLSLSDGCDTVKSISTYNINSGLITNDVKTVFQDIEGNYWIGLYGEGISMMASYAFNHYKPGNNSLENDILYVNKYNDKYLLGTPSGYHLFNPVAGKSVSFNNLTSKVGRSEITSYYLDQVNGLWIGTGGNGLFVRDSSGSVRLFYRSGDSGSDFINDIEIDNQNIWLATKNGVIVLDKRRGREKYRFDINNGLPHNSINKILIGRNGNVYVGTESDRLYLIDSGFSISEGSDLMTGSTKNVILSFSEDNDGNIWAATKGNGIFRCYNDSITAFNRADDLMSNYCYSTLVDSGDRIWIGHEKGISRLDPETKNVKIFGADFVLGGVCNPDGMFESSDSKIFVGTTDGLIIYDRKKDIKKGIAPYTNINSITINDINYDYQPSFSLPYNKKYIIRVNYVGINFEDPENVYYSTYVENYDDDWSKLTTSREGIYSLNDGKYKFSLISVNQAGLSQESPVSFLVFIKAPFWRTWWFILSVIVIFAGLVFLIIREREKAQKKIQEYLEKELEVRTSVVMKQKGEIELQNLEITDSINYAKRIQTSILPDINKIKESFKDAFIFFHPRDIVSGDFYWFDKLDDDKFVLVCADSTGHGVPGAFMSMIGSTLLQDIVSRKRISTPSEILTLLDKQIFSTLNQNVELGVSNDGMDMVVCEFNLKTRHIRFASAMRPVIIVLDGEPYYIKGNRSSVGGESVIEKFFDDQEYYLKEGDTIYLFSDGLPDQFGGIDGKKMKIARLKKLIEQVSKLPMDEQKEAMSKYFFEWKGDHDQVDDILLMGVRV